MKKVLKKMVSVTMAFTMAVGGLAYTKSVDAATTTEEWKENAVITPAEGKLVGAGYIPVEFDNSMEGYTYEVYLDGKQMYWNGDDIVRTDIGETPTDDSKIKTYTSDDSGKTEVYTTTVSKHELTVKAKKDGEEITSDVRTFYVSKKGLALGDDMTDKIALQKLNCSWYYNWGTKAFDNDVDKNVAHVPMMWGNRLGDEPTNKDHKNDIEDIQNLSTTSNYIMGFNEPDIGGQANMNFFTAIDTWNEYISPLNQRKVSPAPASPGGDSSWLLKFMRGGYKCKNPWDGTWGIYEDYEDEATKTFVEGKEEEIDAVVLHYYRNEINLQGLLDAVDTLWNTYHKPIWVTELSLFGVRDTASDFSYEKPGNREKMAEFLQGIVENLDKNPHVERYCWFSYNIDSTNEIDGYNGSGATSMFEYESGLYTELGRLYSNIGNPEGYNAQVISDDEMFVYVEPETTTSEPTTKEQETNTEAPTGKTPVTTTKASAVAEKKPGKVNLKKVQNVKKKSVKMTWQKVKGAKKYEVQYALDSKFKKKLKKKSVSACTLKIGKLTKKKKYFFRVRAINGAGKGSWSNVKRVKIKK